SEAVKDAFIKESDMFKEFGVQYINTYLYMTEKKLCARQLFEEWGPKFGLSKEENDKAIDEAYTALELFTNNMRKKAREAIDLMEKEDKIGIVVLARPYHN